MMCNPTFKIALESGTDFSDTAMMHIWHIEDYVRMKRYGLPTIGVLIENYGDEDEWCLEEDLVAFMKENNIHPDWMKEATSLNTGFFFFARKKHAP